MESVKVRRKRSNNIPTDEYGNLTVNNHGKVSGKKQREKGFCGVYYKKRHSESPDNELGTYTQWNFGAPMPPEMQADLKVEQF